MYNAKFKDAESYWYIWDTSISRVAQLSHIIIKN